MYCVIYKLSPITLLVTYEYTVHLHTCLLDGWYFVVQVEPLEEHLVSVVFVASSSIPVAYCCRCNLHWILSKLLVCSPKSLSWLQLLDS